MRRRAPYLLALLALTCAVSADAQTRAPAKGKGKGTPGEDARYSHAERKPDPGYRHQVAAGPTAEELMQGAESTELRMLREAEEQLFPRASRDWLTEVPGQMSIAELRAIKGPMTSSSPSTDATGKTAAAKSAWLSEIELPSFPVRFEPRVIRFVEFFKDEPRGRALFSYWLKRSGRYRAEMARTLRRKGLPEELMLVSLIESGFDQKARSSAGALGLWQFMPETGRLYGLNVDRWYDQRLDVTASTEAAAEFLSDLYRRFSSWDLALAGYNYGYAGMLSAIRKYNSNDFWTLSRLEGAIPWETTLYVPKLHAMAILMKNLKLFGFDNVTLDPEVPLDVVSVPSGVALADVARWVAVTQKELEALNPEYRAGRAPPSDPQNPATFQIHVPKGKADRVSAELGKRGVAPLTQHVVAQGETAQSIAEQRGVALAALLDMNRIDKNESLARGAVLFVPGAATLAPVAALETPKGEKPVVVVPQDVFVEPDRTRVFYRVVAGDTLPAIADALGVAMFELTRWNTFDSSVRLQEGMTLQAFVRSEADLSRVAVLRESDVRLIVVGTDEFFAHWEGQKGRKRVVVEAHDGDTLEIIGKRYRVEVPSLERINRKGRRETFKKGERVVLYLPDNAADVSRLKETEGLSKLPPLSASSSAPSNAAAASQGSSASAGSSSTKAPSATPATSPGGIAPTAPLPTATSSTPSPSATSSGTPTAPVPPAAAPSGSTSAKSRVTGVPSASTKVPSPSPPPVFGSDASVPKSVDR